MVSPDHDISAVSLVCFYNEVICCGTACCSIFHLIYDLRGDDGITLVLTARVATAPDTSRTRLTHVVAVACSGSVVVHCCCLLGGVPCRLLIAKVVRVVDTVVHEEVRVADEGIAGCTIWSIHKARILLHF